MNHPSRFFITIVTIALLLGSKVQAANSPTNVNQANKSSLKKIATITNPITKKIIPVKAKLSISKTVPKQPVTPTILSAAEVKKLVKLEIDALIKEGGLVVRSEQAVSFEKLQNLNRSYSEDTPGFQSYHIPAAVIAGVGSFFSASNVGAENLNGTNLTSDSATLNSLTVSDGTSLEGGLSLVTPEQGNIIDSDSGAYLSAGGTWTNASSKDLKENFTELDQYDILSKISGLSITRWNYKKEHASTTHIGPLAEDFYAAFMTGGSAGQKAISTIDPAGVALAGIQALSKKLVDLDWLKEVAKKIGIVIEENMIKVKTLIATVIRTDSLEVGSSDLASGITLYDKTTKQPVCVMVDNGALQILPGNCLLTPTETAPPNIPASATVVQKQPSLETDASSHSAATAAVPAIIADTLVSAELVDASPDQNEAPSLQASLLSTGQ